MTAAMLAIDEFEDLATRDFPNALLIVDDDGIAAAELAEAMSEFGYSCFLASSAEQAKKTILRHPEIVTVVTDYYLHGFGHCAGNGLKLIEDLHSLVPGRCLSGVVISGDAEVLADCTLQGAQKFLAKPVAPEALAAMLSEAPRQSPAARSADNSAEQLHQLIISQSEAIKRLTITIALYERNAREIGSRIDRMTSAASIVQKRVGEDTNNAAVHLAQYIVAQGSATMDLTRAQPMLDARSKPHTAN